MHSRIVKLLVVISLGLLSQGLFAQGSYAPLNQDYYHWVDRLEIQGDTLQDFYFSSQKPYQRQSISALAYHRKLEGGLSPIDEANVEYLLNDNWEFSPEHTNVSKKPFLKYLYQQKSDFYSHHSSAFDLHLNPVIYFGLGKERGVDGMNYINTRGVELRGMIDNKIGFYTYLTDNQARFPSGISDQIYGRGAIHGEGFWKFFKEDGVDFLSARGYITFNPTKHTNVQFGHDKHFVGNGYRSLILSDNASSYTFVKASVQVWKLRYSTMFADMIADVYTQANGVPRVGEYPRKKMAHHHLSVNIGKHFNIGLFESVIYSDSTYQGWDLQYLNPIIFYRSVEQSLGSGGANALLGLDFKWNFLRRFSLYGQFVLDEFVLSEVKAGNGWWANKQAGQLGLKYINVGGVSNLDLQLETNIVRPYMYAHDRKETSYTHYHQPLAHPMGANFTEFIAIVRYQPHKRVNIVGKGIFATIGRDSSSVSYGSDVLVSTKAKSGQYGHEIGQGATSKLMYLDLTVSYRIAHNLFVDLKQAYRKDDNVLDALDGNSLYTALSLRWNVARRADEY